MSNLRKAIVYRNKSTSLQKERGFIIGDNTSFTVVEEYKTLRTNIMFTLPSEKCKVIGITSSSFMEGKSTTSLNLALTFAQTKARVLLIDCDLRLPKQSRLLNMDAVPGISNVLVGMNSIEDAIKHTDRFGLDVIFSGDIPPNPSELLGSVSMQKIIATLSSSYDYILVDLPPINIVSDAAVMSKYLSGMIMVVRTGIARKDEVIKAISQLELVNANVIGVVLNGVKSKTVSGVYGKYGKYGKYGRYGVYSTYGKYGKYAASAKNVSSTMQEKPNGRPQEYIATNK